MAYRRTANVLRRLNARHDAIVDAARDAATAGGMAAIQIAPVAARAGVAAGTFSPLLARSAERVAREGYDGLKAGRRVVVPGFANKVVASLVRFVPRPLLLKATDLHQQGRQRQPVFAV